MRVLARVPLWGISDRIRHDRPAPGRERRDTVILHHFPVPGADQSVGLRNRRPASAILAGKATLMEGEVLRRGTPS